MTNNFYLSLWSLTAVNEILVYLPKIFFFAKLYLKNFKANILLNHQVLKRGFNDKVGILSFNNCQRLVDAEKKTLSSCTVAKKFVISSDAGAASLTSKFQLSRNVISVTFLCFDHRGVLP